MRALRCALSTSTPDYRGEYHSFGDVIVDPHAVQDRVPLWVGGRTARSLRRATELGDGWVPFGLSHSRLRSMLDAIEVPPGFEVVLSAGSLDVRTDPGSGAHHRRR